MLQDVSNRIDKAYKNFFRNLKNGVVGFPKFKGKRHYKSFTFVQSGFKFVNNNKRLHLSKIGDVKIKKHRDIHGKIKQLTIKQTKTGKWFAYFSVKIEKTEKIISNGNSIIGCDLGIAKFITFDDGTSIENPRFLQDFSKKIAKFERKLSKAKKRSPRYKKFRRIINKLFEKATNKKLNFFHNEALKLIRTSKTICVEKLNISDMLQSNAKKKKKELSKQITEISWRTFIDILKYKAEFSNCKVIEIDPYNTSKMCSNCGHLQNLSLKDRWYDCPQCGLSLNRDHNAAINILTLGTESLKTPLVFSRSPSL